MLVNLFKYPFFQFGPRYASATNESLVDGYKKLGKGVLATYYILNLATMFTIQTAVTIVTAGIASSIFGEFISVELWAVAILSICFCLLLLGKYKLLDHLMKIIIITLTVSTIAAVSIALFNASEPLSFKQILPKNTVETTFLIAFMGWMPAPLSISIIHSLWTIEKKKNIKNLTPKTALFDFNIGYLSTIIVGIGFLLLGALVMYPTGNTFSSKAGMFANQLIKMHTNSLGNWAYIIIGIAAFTTMFSTTLTTLDALPRAMNRTTKLLFNKDYKLGYLLWMLFLIFGTIIIFFFFDSEMGLLIKIATILGFLAAPFYAITNYILISSKHTPKEWRPSKELHVLSWLGIVFLLGFSVWYLTIL